MPFKPKLLQAVSTGQGQGELWPQLSPRAWLGTPQALPLLGPPVVAARQGWPRSPVCILISHALQFCYLQMGIIIVTR